MVELQITMNVQVKSLQEGKEQKSPETSLWMEVLTKTQKEVNEAKKRIKVTNKGKDNVPNTTHFFNRYLNHRRETKKKSKATTLHVCVTGLHNRDNVEEET